MPSVETATVYGIAKLEIGFGTHEIDFKSRVFGIGPQVGYKFEASDTTEGYVNLKGYYEFGAKNRAEGWNVWLTLAFSPAAKTPD